MTEEEAMRMAVLEVRKVRSGLTGEQQAELEELEALWGQEQDETERLSGSRAEPSPSNEVGSKQASSPGKS
jgi:hypothetical protein